MPHDPSRRKRKPVSPRFVPFRVANGQYQRIARMPTLAAVLAVARMLQNKHQLPYRVRDQLTGEVLYPFACLPVQL